MSGSVHRLERRKNRKAEIAHTRYEAARILAVNKRRTDQVNTALVALRDIASKRCTGKPGCAHCTAAQAIATIEAQGLT